jgi:hypothetical protein
MLLWFGLITEDREKVFVICLLRCIRSLTEKYFGFGLVGVTLRELRRFFETLFYLKG